MAIEGTRVISVRLNAASYEKLQKMAVINKSSISAVASGVINSSFDDIERIDKRVEHLEDLVFNVLDRLTLMQAFNKEVFNTLLLRKSVSLTDEEKKHMHEMYKAATKQLDLFTYVAAKKVMNGEYVWESQQMIDELIAGMSQKGTPQ